MKKLPASCFRWGAGRMSTQHQSQRVWRTPAGYGALFSFSGICKIKLSVIPLQSHSATSQPQSGWSSSGTHPLKSLTSVSEHPITPPQWCLKVKPHFIIFFFSLNGIVGVQKGFSHSRKLVLCLTTHGSTLSLWIFFNRITVVALVLSRGLKMCGFLPQAGIDQKWSQPSEILEDKLVRPSFLSVSGL